jgi:hypothetical protein
VGSQVRQGPGARPDVLHKQIQRTPYALATFSYGYDAGSVVLLPVRLVYNYDRYEEEEVAHGSRDDRAFFTRLFLHVAAGNSAVLPLSVGR